MIRPGFAGSPRKARSCSSATKASTIAPSGPPRRRQSSQPSRRSLAAMIAYSGRQPRYTMTVGKRWMPSEAHRPVDPAEALAERPVAEVLLAQPRPVPVEVAREPQRIQKHQAHDDDLPCAHAGPVAPAGPQVVPGEWRAAGRSSRGRRCSSCRDHRDEEYHHGRHKRPQCQIGQRMPEAGCAHHQHCGHAGPQGTRPR